MSIKIQCLRQFGNAFIHFYMSINSLGNKNVNFKSIKYTVHFKTVLDRAHFTMHCGFGSLVTKRFYTFQEGKL